jgi:hypothetical protein
VLIVQKAMHWMHDIARPCVKVGEIESDRIKDQVALLCVIDQIDLPSCNRNSVASTSDLGHKPNGQAITFSLIATAR